MVLLLSLCFLYFFFNDTASTEIYTYGHTLSLHDALPISGSVSAELAADGTLLRYEEYYPFGDTSLAATSGTKGLSRFQFAGKERDSGTGLYYFGQRYYIPDQARWTAPDPAGTADGPNLFAYVGNNPLTLIDPTGTCGDTPEPAPKQTSPKTVAKKVNLVSTLLNAV